MELNRRDFLKLTGVSASTALLFSLRGGSTAHAAARHFPLKTKVSETTTVCCYCSVGCGALVTTYEDGVTKVEGDPDHPINQGSLCPKGLAMAQIHQVDGKPNSYRLTKPLYRAAGSLDWEEKSWDWMITEIAKKVKATRDASFETTVGGKVVNRCEAIASLGGGELDNEECYVLSKLDRALGLVYLEHCARL